ncbi:MAG TPA: glycosyltransferase family 4 protein [Candidatus Binataceae bacterium]|nr:glycosyltransferase family 4 protein [Candidatus Binataceae bacterium]
MPAGAEAKREPQRVAYVCADRGIPIWGSKGSSVHVQAMVRVLVRRGATVTIFAANTAGTPPPGLEGVGVYQLPAPRSRDAAAEQAQLAANQDLLAALRARGPFELIYERYSLWSCAALEYGRAAGIPAVLEVNAPLIDEQSQYRQLYDRPAAEAVAGRAFAAASRLVAVSAGVAAYLRERLGVDAPIRLIANGVDTEWFRPGIMPASPAPQGALTVGFVGSLKPWHGLDTLVEACARLRLRDHELRLLMVGDGPGRAALTERLRAPDVTFAAELSGAVEQARVPALLASMDIAVAPYPPLANFYFSPLKIFEYMAAGLPVVASRIGQIEEVIEDGRTGLLCPPGDVAALADALERLAADPGLRRKLGMAARAAMLADRSWDSVLTRTLAGLGRAPASLDCGVSAP